MSPGLDWLEGSAY